MQEWQLLLLLLGSITTLSIPSATCSHQKRIQTVISNVLSHVQANFMENCLSATEQPTIMCTHRIPLNIPKLSCRQTKISVNYSIQTATTVS